MYVTDEVELGFYDVLHYYTLPKPSRLGRDRRARAQQAMLSNAEVVFGSTTSFTPSRTKYCTCETSLDYCTSRRRKCRTTCCRIASRPCRRVDMGPAPFDWSKHGRVLRTGAGTKAMQEFGRNAPKKVSHHGRHEGVAASIGRSA